MKKFNFIIISFICFICGAYNVSAASFSLVPSSSTVKTGEEYTVNVKYTGTSLMSAKFNVKFNNVECTGSSSFATVLGKCTGAACEVTLTYVGEDGYGTSTNLYKLKCKSNSVGTSSFSVALSDGDAYDKDDNEVSVSSASKSVKVVASATTTTTKTTTTTITRRPTTKSTTTKKGTTTTKKNTTTAKTTKVSNNIDDTTTSKPLETTTTTVPITDIVAEQITTTTQEPTTKSRDLVPDNLKLSLLKVVGYPFNFKPNKTSYDIVVDENVDEIYIQAIPISESVELTNTGIVSIYGKNQIVIKAFNYDSKDTIEYKINIERRSYNDSIISFILNNSKLIILFGSLAIFVSIVILTLLRRAYNKSIKLDRVDNINVLHEIGSVNSNNNISDGIIEIKDDDEIDSLTKVFNDNK